MNTKDPENSLDEEEEERKAKTGIIYDRTKLKNIVVNVKTNQDMKWRKDIMWWNLPQKRNWKAEVYSLLLLCWGRQYSATLYISENPNFINFFLWDQKLFFQFIFTYLRINFHLYIVRIRPTRLFSMLRSRISECPSKIDPRLQDILESFASKWRGTSKARSFSFIHQLTTFFILITANPQKKKKHSRRSARTIR